MQGRDTTTKLLFDALKQDLEAINLPTIVDNHQNHIEFIDGMMRAVSDLKKQLLEAVAAEHKWIIGQRKKYEHAQGNSVTDSDLLEIGDNETDFLGHMLILETNLIKLERNMDKAKRQMEETVNILELLDESAELANDDVLPETTPTPRFV